MDITPNLSYNENTMRSGDFPDGRGSERETMQMKKRKRKYLADTKKIRRYMQGILLLSLVFWLGGCTRRDELTLELEQTQSVEESKGAEPELSAESGDTALNGAEQELESTDPVAADASGAEIQSQEKEEAQPEKIYIHVCGAVESPGVYELEQGQRVCDAVRMAGGFAGDADEDYVNQAERLSDGAKLVIPTREQSAAEKERQTAELGLVEPETAETPQDSGEMHGSGEKININTASESELCQIPGVGKTRAAAIVAYREAHGAFQKTEDIMKVSGIKEGTFEKIKDSIRVE